MKKKILIGLDENQSMHVIKIETENGYFSITHESTREFMTEEEGEEKARESLEDGELWKMAVEAGSTEQSKEDWIDHVLDVDGWEHVLDAEYLAEYEGKSYYKTWDSFGASVDCLKAEYVLLCVTNSDRAMLLQSEKLHLKDLNKMSERERAFIQQLEAIADKIKINEEANIQKVIGEYLQRV